MVNSLIKKSSLFLLGFVFFNSITIQAQKSNRIWYKEPASSWEETLPLGNGRLGLTPDSGISTESIVLNDITLWSGQPQDANNYEAHTYLPEIRHLLFKGENDKAEALINAHFICEGAGSGNGNGANVPFGSYQTLGELSINFDYESKMPLAIKNYKRELNIDNALAQCSYELDGTTYTREYFASFDDDISIIKLSADTPGKLNLTINLDRPERYETSTHQNELVMSGQLNNGTDGKGMRYKVKIGAKLKDGKLSTIDNGLKIQDATEVILYISAATDFKNTDFEKSVDKLLKDAEAKSYKDQKARHINNFHKLYKRVSVNLGETSRADLPTDERLDAFTKKPEEDDDLGKLYFQFGRYLSISSTRVGLLPPNLQGLWAQHVQTPWNADYHLDVNVEMNHWALEAANLSELNLPLKDLVAGMVPNGQKTAKAYYDADGWIAHVITNVWGYTAPGEVASWGISNAGSGWVCNNLWQHYAFTEDVDYLKEIYPIIKGSAEFYNSMLVKDPVTGWSVTAPSVSPENSFYLPNGKEAHVCMGPTIDNQIARELFTHVIQASEKLNIDAAFREKIKQKLEQLPPPGIVGEDGRIMEWLRPYKEVDPHHRHLSHLYGLYPANLITPEHTPDLAVAAAKTLEARGDDGPSWSIAYKILFWARLKDGNRAYKLLTDILRPTLDTNMNYGAGGGVYPNLLSAGPPFQIDGNFGATAGIAEMLLQSHAGFIELLPALPDSWKTSGSYNGLKARGGFTINVKWEDGKVTDYKIMSPDQKPVKVKVNGKLIDIVSSKL